MIFAQKDLFPNKFACKKLAESFYSSFERPSWLATKEEYTCWDHNYTDRALSVDTHHEKRV